MEARRSLRGEHGHAEEGWGGGGGQPVSRADLCKLRCLVGFCFFCLLFLTPAVLYSVKRSAKQTSEGEVPAGKMPEAQRRMATAAASNNCKCTTEEKPRTHLTPAENQPPPNCASKVLPILHWLNDRPGHNDTITYNNGYLTVPKFGDYFVYAQVTFRCPDGTCEDMNYCNENVSDEIPITQIISKISDSYGSKPIPQLTASISIPRGKKWRETLYLGGVIRLREKDRLMVNVSNPMLVDISFPGITFFGAFLI